MTIEQVHTSGVHRHGASWYNANSRAVDALSGTGLRPWDAAVRDALPRVLLRVLDGIKLSEGLNWNAETGSWEKKNAA